MGKKEQTRKADTPTVSFWRSKRARALGGLVICVLLLSMTKYESYTSLYDAEYVGSRTCGECHTLTYAEWKQSPHANMTRKAGTETVVGDFDDGSWTLPADAQRSERDKAPAARMYQENGRYYMALRHPTTDEYVPFPIEYVIGYQYRQEYLTRETGGVLRRLPLQWSTARQDYFPYWNFQESSTPSVADLWAQMKVPNSAWNLFCARCHTTHLTIERKDAAHTFAVTHWVDDGIACEACHGPGSQHVNYFEHNYINRIAAFLNNKVRREPVAYVASGPKLSKGEDLSVCGRCHGADIFNTRQDAYRLYEPGYSREGRINDLSPYFYEAALEPGRKLPFTLETWADGRPKGLGMLFRSFVESACYREADVRCYDCHQVHNNKLAKEAGLLSPSAASNHYCLECHGEFTDQIEAHSHHPSGTQGSFCYDCHMPQNILNLATGVTRYTRTHTMSSIPDPASTQRHGPAGAPNACNDCHSEKSAVWAQQWVNEWWGERRPGS